MADTVLYISYNGITEPLVRSQVLNYLEGLADKGYRFVLLTFEKARLTESVAKTLREDLQLKGIDWYWLPYHRKPQLLGTALDVWAGTRLAIKLTRDHQVRLIHARSFIPALIARQVKNQTGTPFIYDIRGFWVDEKAYKGSLREGSRLFRWFKNLDKKIYLESSAIVSLSKAGIDEIKSWTWWQGAERPPMLNIPTCVDLEAFQPRQKLDSSSPVFGYVGSLGRGYLGREIFSFFREAVKAFPQSRLLIVSRTERTLLEQWCRETHVDRGRVEMVSVAPNEIPAQVARMDVGLSLIEPHFSKKASCPTKLGEYLAAGVPVVANSGIGDTDRILHETSTGIVLADCSEDAFRDTLTMLQEFLSDAGLPGRCRSVAEEVFSLANGIDAYAGLYRKILS